jgi:hypothetical protein
MNETLGVDIYDPSIKPAEQVEVPITTETRIGFQIRVETTFTGLRSNPDADLTRTDGGEVDYEYERDECDDLF